MQARYNLRAEVLRVIEGDMDAADAAGEKSAEQNGSASAETIRASGQRPRIQTEHKTSPDQNAHPRNFRCNAGAIYTGRFVSRSCRACRKPPQPYKICHIEAAV